MTATVRKLAAPAGGSAADYYCDLASLDLTDYYAGRGESPGVWVGTGGAAMADRLGVEMPTGAAVDDAGSAAFRWLLSNEGADHLLPAHRRQHGGGDRVLAYDLTFGAPKGLSVLAAATGNERASYRQAALTR